MSELNSALFVMYLVAGYLYLWIVSPHTTTASVDVRICIWLFWLPLFIWDILKVLGKVSLYLFEGLMEIFD